MNIKVGDIIQIPEDLKPKLEHILDELSRTSRYLGLCKNKIWDDIYKEWPELEFFNNTLKFNEGCIEVDSEMAKGDSALISLKQVLEKKSGANFGEYLNEEAKGLRPTDDTIAKMEEPNA